MTMLSAAPAAGEATDGELVDAVRGGDHSAYACLYTRHVVAARRQAHQLARCPADVDDLVSTAFMKVLRALINPKGPALHNGFRAYLLTALRHGAYDRTRRNSRLRLVDDPAPLASVRLDMVDRDVALGELEHALVRQAFARLPQRWQRVLWLVEVERVSPSRIAPLFGLTPNGVSALACRAREGLRQAYLQAHITTNGATDGCRSSITRLGAWSRGALPARDATKVRTHLDQCGRCAALAAELADMTGALCRPAA